MNVIIAGAGISGLAAAIALRRTGHQVTMYERSSLNNEIGAAINVPPNISRILIPWGLNPVNSRFVKSSGLRFYSPTTLERLHEIDYKEVCATAGADIYYAHRVDLHESLKQLAIGPKGPGKPVNIYARSGVHQYVSFFASL